MSARLEGTYPCDTPEAAAAMYARQAAWNAQDSLPWSNLWHETVIFEFRRLRDGNRQEDYAGWTQLPGMDRVWGEAKRRDLESGRWTLEGRCNDFAVELKRRLEGRGVPRNCLALVICKTGTGVPHVVLALHADKGTLICDSIQGCWECGDPAFRGYTWIAIELPDGTWESLETIQAGSLEDLARG